MDIAAFEHGQLVHGGSCCGIFSNRAGKRDENFIRVQARVAAAEILGFQGLDWLDRMGGNQIQLLINPGKALECIEQRRGGSAQQRAGFAGYNSSTARMPTLTPAWFSSSSSL